MKLSVEAFVMVFISSTSNVEAGSVAFNSFVTTATRGENDDARHNIATFTARCYYSWQSNCLLGIGGLLCDNNNHDELCSCSIPSHRVFDMEGDSNGYTLFKRTCGDTTCGGSYPGATSCSSSNGCVDDGTESVTVTCGGNHEGDTASGTQTHTMTFTSETPTLDITNLDGSANAYRTQNSGDVIFTATTTSGLAILYWEEATSVANSWILNTNRLFALNSDEVRINSNPSNEYSYDFTMRICAYSRRQVNCGDLDIAFSGCFQTPTCDDKSGTFADTFTVGGTLFTMTVPAPTDHFTAISPTFNGLSYTLDSTDLSVAAVDLTTGDVSTTGNVTVYPSYPTTTYYVIVRVANSESCSYTSTCNMSMTVTFTNWNITFVNLDTSVSIHEDTDARTHLLTIVTFDYNHPDEDNVTCLITTNPAEDLFEMVFNGNPNSSYEYNSAQIYKKVCTNPGCGPMCYSAGCLDYDNVTRYEIVVECADAYGSTATGTLTVNIRENQIPVWTNIPQTITLNTDGVGDKDVIYSIYYTDAENEDLQYNHTWTPDTTLFDFDSWGNYYDDTANVTTLIHQWELTNATFDLYLCGTERRNTLCGTLTIQIREYCGPSPNCTDDSTTVTDQTAAGTTLFTINVPPPATGSFTSLSYSIASPDIALFTLDPTTGVVQMASALPIRNPPDTSRYSITAYVYDTTACQIGTCHLGVNVDFTNLDISIDNVDGVTQNLHEDTKVQNTLLTISTSDANPVDGVACAIDEANSVPANNGKFLVEETFPGSEVYMILNREEPGFDYDVADTYEIVVACNDLYGSTATATMTVSIDENQVPVLSNLPAGTSVSVDLMTVYDGDAVFNLTATDAENDALTYYCNVTDSSVPLTCNTGGAVLLRRNVTLGENGTTYQTVMCVIEPVHSHTVCETLSVVFTSSRTEPEIDNLPYSASFDENTSIGTSLYNVSVTDSDVGDTHTFTMEYIQPLGSESQFSFSRSSGLLTLASSFDFETQTAYNLTFSVRDHYLTSAAYKTLYLVVNDINEAPNLTLVTTQLSTTEGSTGQVIGTVDYICDDVDAGQTMAISLSSGTHITYFTLDPATNVLSLAQDWDFEAATLPETTTLNVTCNDGAGLTDTQSLDIAIDPVNEFPPVLSLTEIELTIYSNQTLQDWLFNVTATDADYNDDGQFVFSIIGNWTAAQHFHILSTGHFYLSHYIDWYYNYTFILTVEVSDGEAVPLTASVNVTIHYIAAESEPYVPPTKCLLCTPAGVAVVSTICVGSLLITCFIIHACVRTKCWTLCQSEPIRMHEHQRRAVKRRRKKREFVEMIQSALHPDIEEEEYEPQHRALQKALPKTEPPDRFLYLGRRNNNNIPGPINYIPEVKLENVPEPEIISDDQLAAQSFQSAYQRSPLNDLDLPPVSPSQAELYGGPSIQKPNHDEQLVPSRLFSNATAAVNDVPSSVVFEPSPAKFTARKSATKRKWDWDL